MTATPTPPPPPASRPGTHPKCSTFAPPRASPPPKYLSARPVAVATLRVAGPTPGPFRNPVARSCPPPESGVLMQHSGVGCARLEDGGNSCDESSRPRLWYKRVALSYRPATHSTRSGACLCSKQPQQPHHAATQQQHPRSPRPPGPLPQNPPRTQYGALPPPPPACPSMSQPARVPQPPGGMRVHRTYHPGARSHGPVRRPKAGF